jgi:hypothetical protein
MLSTFKGGINVGEQHQEQGKEGGLTYGEFYGKPVHIEECVNLDIHTKGYGIYRNRVGTLCNNRNIIRLNPCTYEKLLHQAEEYYFQVDSHCLYRSI